MKLLDDARRRVGIGGCRSRARLQRVLYSEALLGGQAVDLGVTTLNRIGERRALSPMPPGSVLGFLQLALEVGDDVCKLGCNGVEGPRGRVIPWQRAPGAALRCSQCDVPWDARVNEG